MRLHFLVALFLTTTLFAAQQKSTAKPPTHPAEASKPSASSALPSEETVNGFMQAMFGYQPDVTWKIQSIKPAEAAGLAEVDVLVSSPQGQQSNKFYVTPDGTHAVVGDIMPFGEHPFAETRRELEKSVTGPARGPANAAVTIVEFSDLQCPHCKEAQPALEQLLSSDKNVRLIFQNFPLPSHDWAAKAAAYADCTGRSSNDAFWKFISSVYDNQSQITAANADEKLSSLADQAGVKGAEMATCAAQPGTTSRVQASEAFGHSQDVTSTPTMFINGRKIPGGVPYEILKKLVDFAAKPQ